MMSDDLVSSMTVSSATNGNAKLNVFIEMFSSEICDVAYMLDDSLISCYLLNALSSLMDSEFQLYVGNKDNYVMSEQVLCIVKKYLLPLLNYLNAADTKISSIT